MIKIDNEYFIYIINNNYKTEFIQLLNLCIDKELAKSPENINCNLIDYWVNIILKIENMG